MPILEAADVKPRMVCKQSQVNGAPVAETVVDRAKKEFFGYGCRRPNRKEPLSYLLERTAEVEVGLSFKPLTGSRALMRLVLRLLCVTSSCAMGGRGGIRDFELKSAKLDIATGT